MAIAPVILADADNTLWDTDSVFAQAQLGLLADVDRLFDPQDRVDPLGHIRAYDQALAKIDHRHLRYPPHLLVRALALGNRGHGPGEAARLTGSERTIANVAGAEEAIVERYFEALGRGPELLNGVVDGLVAARDAGFDVWILTEGSADRQRARAATLGITHLVKGVSECTKSIEQFDRQRRRFAPAPVFVIGDQPDRDILPAQTGGCTGVLVPSGFRPGWIGAAAWDAADYVADRFDRAIDWIIATTAPSRAAAE
ncbi:Haloacid dehalogenase domain protein hydrolase [Sphingobium chlorophenolicum L-1]|uniref:Haloacid dehalogenase domain protein hydrolase n=1 Tax=Sphingobium chlorophenolicum L-1 TaxID=690566 RepID=F6EUS2_SPHCR|nr:HAD hydrolase-like protein [Sphingobium chlorophenolicum]AEG49605.1 Haloacid dehalogenase domain protein hydrolase [Sphingobium chlorophenolicum L-1]